MLNLKRSVGSYVVNDWAETVASEDWVSNGFETQEQGQNNWQPVCNYKIQWNSIKRKNNKKLLVTFFVIELEQLLTNNQYVQVVRARDKVRIPQSLTVCITKILVKPVVKIKTKQKKCQFKSLHKYRFSFIHVTGIFFKLLTN